MPYNFNIAPNSSYFKHLDFVGHGNQAGKTDDLDDDVIEQGAVTQTPHEM